MKRLYEKLVGWLDRTFRKNIHFRALCIVLTGLALAAIVFGLIFLITLDPGVFFIGALLAFTVWGVYTVADEMGD